MPRAATWTAERRRAARRRGARRRAGGRQRRDCHDAGRSGHDPVLLKLLATGSTEETSLRAQSAHDEAHAGPSAEPRPTVEPPCMSLPISPNRTPTRCAS
jgi:hypothetical protein